MVQLLTALRLVLAIAFPALALTAPAGIVILVYLAGIGTDLADGALARHWRCATRGGDWFDAFADRMLTTMSGVYGALIGASTLACSAIIARDLAAVSMNELESEGGNRRARFLGIVTVTPIRVLTLYVLCRRFFGLGSGEVSSLYWFCAVVAWSTFAVNAWLRREVMRTRFREPDVEKLLR
jgi:phosphatidylglycerophosphate synthase